MAETGNSFSCTMAFITKTQLNMIDKIKKKILSVDRKPFSKGLAYSLINTHKFSDFLNVRKIITRPIFIGGCGRSGTTLLLSLLSTQPNILAIPEETYAFSPFPNKTSKNKRKRYIDQIIKNILKQNIEGKERFVEKTPANVLSYDRIVRYFGGNCSIVNIVRDGRDVITSKHPTDPESYYIDPKRWIRDVSSGKKFEALEQVITIKYEKLVSETIDTIERVCWHCDIEFDRKGIIDYPSTSQFAKSNAWHGKARPISNKSVGRWKKNTHNNRVQALYDSNKGVDLLKFYDYMKAN